MSNRKVAFSILLVLLFQAIVPIIPVDATSGRAMPSVSADMTFSLGGSIDDGTDVKLSPGAHLVEITVSNTGGNDAEVTINLKHKASLSSAEIPVTSINAGTLQSGASDTYLINWTAQSGDGQTLTAEVVATDGPDVATVDTSKQFDVTMFHQGNVLGDNIPSPSGGSNEVRLNHSIHTFDASVINKGVMDISSVLELNFTDNSDPTNRMSFWSGTDILDPGSLATLSTGMSLSATFDAALITGTWTLSARVIFNGTGWTNTVITSVETVTFSDFIISVSEPDDRSTEPGATTSLTWLINNLGSTDSLTVQHGSDQGWHTYSGNNPLVVPAGQSTSLVISVAVPSNAAKPTLENVYLNLSSTSSDPYTISTVGHVLVGDTYQAQVIAKVSTPVNVTPANTTSVSYDIQNDGTMPSAFKIAAGLTMPADNWQWQVSTDETAVIPVGESRTVTVFVTPAPISSPLLISERNAAGDTLSTWLSATPVSGGMPSFNSTQLVVEAIITVDPGPEIEDIVLTEEEILDANASGGIDRILSLSVEVRHNLGSSISSGVDAEISVSTPVFTPLNAGGLNEPARWLTSVTPSSVSNLQMDEVFQSWLAIDGPSDELPMAGELIIPVTAYPVLSQTQIDSGVKNSSVTRNIVITVPSIANGTFSITNQSTAGNIISADVGNTTTHSLNFSNTGNDLSSYRLEIEDDLPPLWSVILTTPNQQNPSIVENLPPSMSDHPLLTTNHISQVTLDVTTDPQAGADTLQPVTLIVEDRDTGDILNRYILQIRVEESINFELLPSTNETITLSPQEERLTYIYVNNTGNIATTFNIWMDDSLQNDVNFNIESSSELIVGPGYNKSIKIRLIPDSEASADEFHMVTIWVAASNGMNLSATVNANISADHHLAINVQDLIEVTPGVNETIDVTFGNTGNLEESLDVAAVIEGNWSASWEQDQIVLPINSTLDNDLTVAIPALGGEFAMSNGDTYNVTISLYHSANGDFLASRTIVLQVSPIFVVEVEDWPEEMFYYRYASRDWSVNVTNVGNKDVNVDLQYDILQPGLEINSVSWEIESSAPNIILLPVGKSVQLDFTVEAKEFEPDLYLEALPRLTMSPSDIDVTGSAIRETELKMSRLFSYQDFQLEPSEDSVNLTRSITWSHIPEGSDPPEVSYLIELCNAERRVNLTAIEDVDESNYPWSFGIDVDGTTEVLDLGNNCDDGTHSVITLPPRAAWDTIDPLQMIIDAPDRPYILKNDGYNLTFRLYHPDDNSGFTEYTEATFAFYFAAKAIPVIDDLSFSGDSLEEGQISDVTANLRNDGTSIALWVTAELTCVGIEVNDPVITKFVLQPGEEYELTWEVESDHLDWWVQSSDVSCLVELNSRSTSNQQLTSKTYALSGQVESWSPSIGFSFIATLALIGASIGLLRLVGQNDKFRLAAIYSGVLALGFSFHLLDLVWWGPVVLLGAALWLWFMTWRSSVEFQLIHEDYQRARKGISTLYSDHFDVLSNAKRQLSIILAMPVLGMIGVILGLPPQMEPDSTNMVSLVGYLVLVIGGVIFIIWNSNRMYGSLYGRLTEVEVQASRIERDLGDPARLLTELASDGLDLSSIISQPRPNVAAAGEASSADVANWDDEVGVLLDEESNDGEDSGATEPIEIDIDDLLADESTDSEEEVEEDA